MKYYFNAQDGLVYAFETTELAEIWCSESLDREGVLKEMTDAEIDRHLNPQKFMTDDEQLSLARNDAVYLSRSQFLTMTEIELNKNKDALIALIQKDFKGKTLVKLRNQILENQNFSLTDDDLWQFLTMSLGIEEKTLFNIWQEAKENY